MITAPIHHPACEWPVCVIDCPYSEESVGRVRRAAEHVVRVVDGLGDWSSVRAAADGLRRALAGAPAPDEEGL